MVDTATAPGWYAAEGDPPGTQRYWDGTQWVGGPVPGAAASSAGYLPEINRNLAPAWGRVGARLIDAIIVAIVGGVASIPVFIITGLDQNVSEQFLASLVGLGLGGLFEVIFIAKAGATPGKLMLSYEVVTITGETPPPWSVAVKRWLPDAVGVIPFFIGGFAGLVMAVISFIFLFSDSRRRTIYDRFAGTYVVRKR